MSAINLLLDEENELTFQLNIEGSRPAESKCRLKIDNSDIGLIFEGNSETQGEVSVVLPPLTHILKEGTYDMILEVIVDEKYFTPLTIQGSFEKSVKVTAEAIVRKREKIQTKVTAATLVESSKKTNKRNSHNPPVVVKNSKTRSVESKVKQNNISDKDILKIIEALQKRKG
mgnify:CR=1 FL=1|tara:strand:+ start:343 stop:858 length:516 start_codon:yes stop_codon:yes gene_type:complete